MKKSNKNNNNKKGSYSGKQYQKMGQPTEYGTSSRRATKLLKADRWIGESGGEQRGAGGGVVMGRGVMPRRRRAAVNNTPAVVMIVTVSVPVLTGGGSSRDRNSEVKLPKYFQVYI